MLKEKEGAIVDARRTCSEAARIALLLVFFFYKFLLRFPFNTKRRICQHVIKLLVRKTIFGKRVAKDDVVNVLPLNHHV